MNALASVITAFEGAPLPDSLRRVAVRILVEGARRNLAAGVDGDAAFAKEMAARPIAEHTKAANDQHYELPAAFFQRVLGPRLKYSSCLYPTGGETLGEAEDLALHDTVAHAELRDGQHILELGCGWGSLSLWMAEVYPNAKITSVSNSASQKDFIDGQMKSRGIGNLQVVTADMNEFTTEGRFDRVVSVEMFEHMANWRDLLAKVHVWLLPEGRLFLHVFSHRTTAYRFNADDPTDWIAQHFFTGGLMPSHELVRQFSDLFILEQDWRWSGGHYARTANDWLKNFDDHAGEIGEVLREAYREDAKLWARRWRLFFLATAGLFGHAGGQEWGVSHYLLRPVA
ncbi:cyclopropane-fatty-acyl-phospholipid synthase family protein [Caulobacter sp. S45]|uniref:SAM-dependent methyltransferase n=1 Tax=Caulobacter sp. S45 TaxID=1641861 RepID=UPI001575DEDC|nr:cyclopropane-fatty-acyl-phospholipid synthase family protein [Caulobacter sp. S45]